MNFRYNYIILFEIINRKALTIKQKQYTYLSFEIKSSIDLSLSLILYLPLKLFKQTEYFTSYVKIDFHLKVVGNYGQGV